MLSLILLGLLAFPILEIYLLVQVGKQIGTLNTFILLAVTAMIGSALAKRQGIHILQQIQQQLSQNQLPAEKILYGLLAFIGGMLLLFPGFISDILGLSMLLPGTRYLWAKLAIKIAERSMAKGSFRFQSFHYGQWDYHQPSSQEEISSHKSLPDDVIEAEFEKRD